MQPCPGAPPHVGAHRWTPSRGDPHTRFEQFTKYVEEHPTETIAHMQASADAKLEAMIADRDSSDALDDSSEGGELTADDLAFPGRVSVQKTPRKPPPSTRWERSALTSRASSRLPDD